MIFIIIQGMSFMNKKRYNLLYFLIIPVLIIFVFIINGSLNKPSKYLNIICTSYNDNNNDSEVSMIIYNYSISDDTMEKLVEIPINSTYPVAITDYKNKKVYYSNSENFYLMIY